MHNLYRVLLVALAVAPFGLALAAAAGAANAGLQERLMVDTAKRTRDGATFVAPAGWLISTNGEAVILSPEGDSKVALVDVRQRDADAAVQVAWAAVRPGMKWAVKVATDSPGQEGWDLFRDYEYEVSPNEHRAVGARAAKRGEAWTVVIYDMDLSIADKRSGQTAVIFDRLLPPNYQRESFAGKKANKLSGDRLTRLSEFVEMSREALGVPGVALSLYQDGQIIAERGFGVRELGKPAAVDADTLFMIASNTKSMTTLLLATLVDEGKLTWDTPVISVMPHFRLGDAETTRQVLIKHLVCACTGLPRQDYEWLLQFQDATPLTELALLATFQPTSRFGEMFQYSNLLAASGGFVAAHVLFPGRELGSAYDDAMRLRVFGPLGMTSTTFDFAEALAGNHASPHAWDPDAVTAPAVMACNYSIVPLRPAGGAWSNVKDVMRYLRAELSAGLLPNGQRMASSANVIARRKEQVKIGNDVSYGMGLEVDRKYGIPVVHHGGSMIGYKSDMIYLPEHDVAAVLMANSDEGSLLVYAFRRRLLEILFDGKPEAENKIKSDANNMKLSLRAERARLTIPADLELARKLAKRYSNPSLGEISVERAGAETRFNFGEWKSAVASRKNDDGTFSFVTIVPGFSGMPFVVGQSDDMRTLTFRDAQQNYVFKEVK